MAVRILCPWQPIAEMTLATLCWLTFSVAIDAADPVEPKAPADAAAVQPILKLDFDSQLPADAASLAGGAKIEAVGPSAKSFLGMPEKNAALVLDGKGGRVRIVDSSDERSLAFKQGDAITLEAWVRIDKLASGANVYIIGKGRTYETRTIENQNYALRLTGAGGEARVSFLFATNADTADGDKSQPAIEYHRWTSDRGFVPDGLWHHVATSYRFGTPESIVGVVDGEKVKGKWDMGGATKAPPIVDNDAVWIGSSRGGDKGNSLTGAVDNVMIHRELVPAAVLMARRKPIALAPAFPERFDDSRVTITLHPNLSTHGAFPAEAPAAEFAFQTRQLAIHRLPMRYIAGGLRDPWPAPLLLRAYCKTKLPAGELTWLVRSPGLSRLWIDGKVVLTTPAHPLFPDAHQPFEVYEADHPWLRVPRAGDAEKRVPVSLDAGIHEIVLESIVGAKSIRSATGELTVAVRRGDELFTLMAPVPFETPLTDAAWEGVYQQTEHDLVQLERKLLRESSAVEDSFWQQRHEQARKAIATREPIALPASVPGAKEHNFIDRFLNAAMAEQAKSATKTVNGSTAAAQLQAEDAVFLRRIYLDTVGVLPTAEQTQAFLSDSSTDKRKALIDRLLGDDRWADHWTSYWQDVLAENPSILKPTLNNTGPFRWWIYDAIVENKPMDRFVTELIRMEGSRLGGGAAGFGMASENDVPMAAKAHILTSAFLGVEMKCARCHDAPYHPWTQKELFGLAAMLDNQPIKVPPTSSVPKEFFDRKKGASPLSLSIFPGDMIEPAWPFKDLNAAQPTTDMLGRENASRERLAALVTAPENDRFAEVLVNRLWQRVMGWGFVNHVGDWYEQVPRHPELLKSLARDLVAHDYDFKHTARTIFNSAAYQREAIDGERTPNEVAHFAPWIRRLTAEQVVDSLHALAGYELGTEEITFDPSTQQKWDSFISLGVARRAWQLTSLSNERDRPSLSLPKAAVVVECLEAFGWRGSRQDPVSHRETDANMVQPGVIANSALSVRLSRLSEGSHFTDLALAAKSPEEFVQLAFEQILSRKPDAAELKSFVEQVAPGFEDRIVTLAVAEQPPSIHRGFVTWANHFDIRANQLMRDIEREVAQGPPASSRLKQDWRERAEDAIWALMNTPEFQFIP